MKASILALSLALSACGSAGVRVATPPTLADDAGAAEVFEAWRTYAVETDRRMFVHLGAPW